MRTRPPRRPPYRCSSDLRIVPSTQRTHMPTRFSIRITAVAIASGLVLALLAAWRADRRDRAQLAADLAAAKQLLAQAEARHHLASSDHPRTPATNPAARAHNAASLRSHEQAAKGNL